MCQLKDSGKYYREAIENAKKILDPKHLAAIRKVINTEGLQDISTDELVNYNSIKNAAKPFKLSPNSIRAAVEIITAERLDKQTVIFKELMAKAIAEAETAAADKARAEARAAAADKAIVEARAAAADKARAAAADKAAAAADKARDANEQAWQDDKARAVIAETWQAGQVRRADAENSYKSKYIKYKNKYVLLKTNSI